MKSNRITEAGTTADSDMQPIVHSSADIEASPMLAAVMNGFFKVLWVISLIAWLIFVFTGNVMGMWISNLFMWVGVFGMNLYPNCR